MATYKEAGVNIEAGDNFVKSIKLLIPQTFNKYVLKNIGSFGGFFEIPKNYKKPVLISSVDGVGTKLKIAFAMNKHDTIGQCLVNHCVNDIAVCGAKPLFFLDYFACGILKQNVAIEIIKGFVKACKENDCALIGGETAEMPSFYAENEYDISGTIVGIVEKKLLIDGSKIKKGDILLGLSSNGLHTNGYSLARKVLLSKYKLDNYIPELQMTLGEELLKIHKSYLKIIQPLLKLKLINGMAHITGGGIINNTLRIIPEGLTIKINWNCWNIPPIFEIIQKLGDVPQEDMRQTFNLGIGLVLIVSNKNVAKVITILKRFNENTYIIGEVIKDK